MKEGTRVLYLRPGTRHMWQGKVTGCHNSQLRVLWDECEGETDYTQSAYIGSSAYVVPYKTPLKEGDRVVHKELANYYGEVTAICSDAFVVQWDDTTISKFDILHHYAHSNIDLVSTVCTSYLIIDDTGYTLKLVAAEKDAIAKLEKLAGSSKRTYTLYEPVATCVRQVNPVITTMLK